jgi:copper homeostasis protein
MNFKLEICVDTLESALDAQNAGADRVELCSNLIEGGTTPGYGTLTSVRNSLDIDLNVIIRPRGGDFLYTDQEYDVMRRDIDICGECGVNGIVLGILQYDGEIDIERTARLVEIASPMTVTFHRAFDMCCDPIKGLEDVIVTGAVRILTSGQQALAVDGIELLGFLKNQAADRVIIMPGSGINDKNIERIARTTGASEFHLTARKIIESEMVYRKQGISMGGIPGIPEFARKIVDPSMIRNIINILNSL